MSERETETVPLIEAILAKKAETRPVTPEEYQVLTAFNDRVQRSAMEKRLAVRLEQMRRLAEVRDSIPAGAYQTELPATGLPERILTILAAAGFTQAGPVLEALGLDENSHPGIGGHRPEVDRGDPRDPRRLCLPRDRDPRRRAGGGGRGRSQARAGSRTGAGAGGRR